MGRHLDDVVKQHQKSSPLGKIVLTLGAVGLAWYLLSPKEQEIQSTTVETTHPVIEVNDYNSNELKNTAYLPDTVFQTDTVYNTDTVFSNPLSISDEYKLIITNQELNLPFTANSKMYSDVLRTISSKDNARTRASKIFEWVMQDDYVHDETLSDAEEVYTKKQGDCGELTYQFVTGARLAGLNADYVYVNLDDKGKTVNHACASVEINGERILVDPAYHKFDIKHQDYEVKSDSEAIQLFRQWNGLQP